MAELESVKIVETEEEKQEQLEKVYEPLTDEIKAELTHEDELMEGFVIPTDRFRPYDRDKTKAIADSKKLATEYNKLSLSELRNMEYTATMMYERFEFKLEHKHIQAVNQYLYGEILNDDGGILREGVTSATAEAIVNFKQNFDLLKVGDKLGLLELMFINQIWKQCKVYSYNDAVTITKFFEPFKEANTERGVINEFRGMLKKLADSKEEDMISRVDPDELQEFMKQLEEEEDKKKEEESEQAE